MRLQFQGLAAGQQLLAILDPNHPSGAVRHLRKPVVKRHAVPVSPPEPAQVLIYGKLKVGTLKSDHATVLGTHNSPPLKDIIKIMLCYSDNTMAQKFGEMIGGPKALTDMVITQLGVPAAEVNFATTSGLDVNRITPRAMMKVVTALRQYLIDHQLSLSDLLAVSGIDDGTMKDRLNDADEKGSVVSKTGTLTTTDEGASALSGEMHTKGISSSDATSDATATTTEGSGTEGTTPDSTTTTTTTSSDGTYLFVIFEMHGDVNGFRQRQNTLVSDFQKAHGGPQAITYTPILPRVNGEDFWK
jgi:hypothetical protein